MDCLVQARNSYLCSFTPPCRSEVRNSNYQRRCYQKKCEGLFAPIDQPFKELGYPLIIDAPSLVKSVLGCLPQRPNILTAYEPDDSIRGSEERRQDGALLKASLNTVELTSESVEKSCQPLRPKQFRVNEKVTTYPVQSVSAYMERRRKRGLINFKKVIQQSNDTTNCVIRGRSFFGILNQEIIQKIHNFWDMHYRIIESRKSRIIPPVRGYTLNKTIITTTTPEQSNPINELTEKVNDEIDEDVLLDEEPEIRKLMSHLIAAGCNLQYPLSDSSRELSDKVKDSRDYSTLAMERRRHRQYKQWYTEPQRPFTPRFFNICRPDFGAELENDTLDKTYELLNCKKVEQVGNSMKSNKQHDKESFTDSVCDLIYIQLCCVLWLLEQMYLSSTSETDPNWRPISASWKFSSDSSLTEMKTSSDEQSHPDQIWYHFIYETSDKQPKMKSRFHPVGSAHSINSIQSGTASSEQGCTTPVSSITKLQPIKGISRSVVGSTDDLSDGQSTRLSKSGERFNLSSPMNSQERINSANPIHSTSRSLTNSHKKINLLSSKTDTSVPNRRCVQFLKKSYSPQSNENQWVNYRNQIQNLSKETLTEMAHRIEVELDKESLKEAELRLITSRGEIPSKNFQKRPFTIGSLKEIPKEFTSHKFTNLVDNIRTQLSIMTDEKAVELEDRLEFMKQIRPEICLAKYHSIPVKGHTHIAMKRMHKLARYDKAAGELARKTAQKKELAPWYVDLLTDLKDLKREHKIIYILSKLKFYAHLSPSQFTVLSFTRVLRSLTLWEILSPANVAAIDFIRMRVLDMSIEEYLDWLCEVHPNIKECITNEPEF
ncbi:unnamed protein product [Heterobilharzia americana]|nr:unnamed protein product [Heterobilharzia americana]